jgi:hypothetical protein
MRPQPVNRPSRLKQQVKKVTKPVVVITKPLPQYTSSPKQPVFKIRYEHYLICMELDEREITFEIKAPTVDIYNDLVSNKDNKQFMFDCVVSPDRSNVQRIIDEYPGIVDSFTVKAMEIFKNHNFQLSKEMEKKWKSFEKDYYGSALTLLDWFDKPKTETNVAFSLLLIDAMGCLRHLRQAYSEKK